jgi:integrase/recombinase XerD
MRGNNEHLASFLSAKGVEGCSGKTIDYYRLVISMALEGIDKPLLRITTLDRKRSVSPILNAGARHGTRIAP